MKQNKLFKLWLLAVILFAGSGGAWGATVTLQLSSTVKFGTTSGSTLTQSSVTWTATSTSGAIQNTWNNANYLGQQFGISSTPWTGTFTAPEIAGATITQIAIRANTGGSATLATKVGTTNFLSGGNATVSVVKNSSATETNLATYSFTGSASGAITVTVSGTSAAFYLNNIIVTYTTAPTCTTPTYSFASSSVNKLTTDAAFTNAFTSDNTSAKVWSSSNTGVATVNSSTEEVTIVGAGTASIKVNQAADATYCAVVDASYTLTVTKPEPSNHAASFTATAKSSSQITVNWADATGTQVPDGYLVKASTGTSAAPSDGTAETDAALVKNIVQGTQTAVFTGLSPSTTYNFSIWPYTNSGTAINYKTDGELQTASATTAIATNISDNFRSKSSGNWNDVNTWESSSNGTNWISATLTPTSAANNITVLNGNAVTVTENISVDQLTLNVGGKLIVNSNITLTIANGSDDFDLLVEGTVENSGTITASTDAAIKFNSGGYYNHTRNGGPCVIATWDVNSTCEITGVKGTSMTNLSQSFGNFVWNCTGQTSWIDLALTSSFSTAGNWTINSTGGGTVGLNVVTSTASRTLNIGGNLFINGGKLTLANNSGIATLNIGGDLILSASTLNQLDLGYGSFDPTGNYRSIINLSGDLKVESGATLTCTDNNTHDDYGSIVLKKSGTQNIYNTGTISWIDFEVDNGSTSVLNSNLDIKNLQINSGGVINVSAAKQLTVTGTATNNGTIKLLSNSTDGTATLVGNVTGTAEVNQAVNGYRTYYLGSPVSAVTALSGITAVSTFNVSGDSWADLITTNIASSIPVDGTGFLGQVGDAGTSNISLTGTLNSGNKTVELVNSGKLFNFLGNPYPSYLDGAKVVDNTNVEKSIWYRTKADGSYSFVTYNVPAETSIPAASATNNGFIPPMQGFWVKATAAGTFTFTDAMRTHNTTGTNIPLKAPQPAVNQILRLQVSNGTASDETVVLFNENAQSGYDAYDASKMMNTGSSALNIYTKLGTENLVLNSQPAVTYDAAIPVEIKVTVAGEYTISANEFSHFAEGEKVQLVDGSVVTDLTQSGYTFTASANDTRQFSVVFPKSGVPTGVDQNGAAGITVFVRNNRIVVTAEAATQGAMVQVFNSVGQRVASQAVTGTVNEIGRAFPAGVYVVKVNNQSSKIIIR